MSEPRRSVLAAAIMAGVLAGCSPLETVSTLEPGSWGGEHLLLTITADSAHLEYDCATGTMALPVTVRANGLFQAVGVHYIGHGGPIREGEAPDAHPARYDGRVDGGRMKLTVTLTDLASTLGPFELERGRTAHVFKCL